VWIYTERRDLIPYLVRGHKKRHKRSSDKKSRVSKIPNRIDITERPPHVDLRAQAGHWEVDTVVSRQSKACVAVLVERKSWFFTVIAAILSLPSIIVDEFPATDKKQKLPPRLMQSIAQSRLHRVKNMSRRPSEARAFRYPSSPNSNSV
jgi:IS30 family transposase